MDKKYLKLNDIDAYRLSFHLSNYIWDLTISWEWYAKKHWEHNLFEQVTVFLLILQKDLADTTKKTRLNFTDTVKVH